MTITVAHITPLVALIAGILILIFPRLLNYVVALYLIIIGLDRPQQHPPFHPLSRNLRIRRRRSGLRHRRPL